MENKTKCYCGHTIYCDCSPLEELKQETLEDYVLDSDEHNNLKSDDGTYLNFHRQSELLLKGAKLGSEWQQKQEQSNENSWFNEYQKVEDYIIKRIGD